MPKVSVLMPAYNAEQYINQAIDSIISQTYTDWELIIANDGSTDNTENIILSYSDPRIKYIKSEINKGLIYTRNLLITNSLGKYIAFLDSDDLALPNRLEQQVNFLDNNQDYGLCGTWGMMIDDKGDTVKKINLPSNNEEIKCSLLFINTFVQSSIMIHKQILVKYPYNNDFPLAEDYELWCGLSRSYKLKNLPVHLAKYRWHETNISKSRKKHLDSLVKNIYKRELEYIGIEASEEELLLHAAIKDKNILNTPKKEYFNKLSIWLKKVSKEGVNSGKYNKDILMATIAFRWIFACKEWKVQSKTLAFPISLSLRGYRILFKMLRERI